MHTRLLRPALRASFASATLLSLGGCGGGSDSTASDLSETSRGGGAVTLKITAKNGPLLARDTLDLATSLHDLAGLNYGALTGAAVDTARRVPDVITFAYRHLRWLTTVPVPGGETLGGIVITRSFPCADGGSFTVAFDDADSNGLLTSGDGATFTFSACAAEGTVSNGRIAYSGISLTGPAAMPTGMSTNFSYAELRVLDAGIETTVDGSARYSVQVTTSEPDPLVIHATTVIPSLAYSSTDGWGYTLTNVESRTESDYGLSTYVFTTAGTISDRAFGSMAVTTQTRFDGTLGQPPERGRMSVLASDRSQVRLTVLGTSGVQVEVDANADGRFDSSAPLTWAALNAL